MRNDHSITPIHLIYFHEKSEVFNKLQGILFIEGTVPVPPEPPLRFAMVLYYFLRSVIM